MKFKQWFNIKKQTFFKRTTDPMRILDDNLAKFKQRLNSAKEAYYTYTGKIKYYQQEIESAESIKCDLISSSKKVLEVGDDVLLSRCQKEMEILLNKIDRLNKNLLLAEELAAKALEQKNITAVKVSETESIIDDLKMKKDFKDEIDKHSDIFDASFANDNFDSIVKNINIEFNASEVKFEDLKTEKQSVIETVQAENKIELFKKMLSEND